VLLFAAPFSVAAQQRDSVVTPEQRALERLRARAPLIVQDTVVRDTGVVADSLVPPPPQQVRLVDDTAVAASAGAVLAGDSVAQQFLRLGGYVATEYAGPFARYSADSATLRLTGQSRVVREGQILNADSSIVFYENSGFACGYGSPRLEGGDLDAPLASDSLCYDVDRQIGRAYGLRTSVTEGATWFVKGQCWTVEDRLYCHDTVFTDCELEEPHTHYGFKAQSLKVLPSNVMVARDVTLQFADVPVFWLPVMVQSLARGRRSGILFPQFGMGDIARTSSSYNRRISNVGFFWAINDYLGLELTGGWEANNHSKAEASFEYNVRRQFLQGGLTVSRFWLDNGSRELTLRTTNSWLPNERTRVGLDASYASSTSLIRQRSYDPREMNRSIDSNASFNRRFDWGSLTLGGTRRQQLHNDRVTLKLPGASLNIPSLTLFDALPGEERWFSNLAWTGSATANYDRTDVAAADPDATRSTTGVVGSARHSLQLGSLQLRQSLNFTETNLHERTVPDTTLEEPLILPDSSRADLGWDTQINYQQRLFGRTTLTPSVTLRGARVTNNGELITEPMRMNFGASLGTELFGFFPGVGPFQRLRHRLSPSISYSYSPKPEFTERQSEFFGRTLSESNALTFGLTQSFEAKYRQSEAERAAADSAAAADTTGGPRRRPDARIITLLSISTSSITYDFVQARERGEGLTNTSLSNTLSTDLLPGFSLNISHDLFERLPVADDAPEGERGERRFDPFLRSASFGLNLDSESWIARLLGIGKEPRSSGRGGRTQPGAAPADTIPPVGEAQAQGDITGWTRGSDERLIGQGSAREQQRPEDAAVGTWSANLDYVLSRERPVAGDDGDDDSSQTVRGSFRMQPTRFWALSWSTGYDFSDGEFSDHILTLTRKLHDFDANFDFMKAQNGNFTFQFRVQLRANPDLKVDYTQRDLNRNSSGFRR
jgi:hypothetical protein